MIKSKNIRSKKKRETQLQPPDQSLSWGKWALGILSWKLFCIGNKYYPPSHLLICFLFGFLFCTSTGVCLSFSFSNAFEKFVEKTPLRKSPKIDHYKIWNQKKFKYILSIDICKLSHSPITWRIAVINPHWRCLWISISSWNVLVTLLLSLCRLCSDLWTSTGRVTAELMFVFVSVC